MPRPARAAMLVLVASLLTACATAATTPEAATPEASGPLTWVGVYPAEGGPAEELSLELDDRAWRIPAEAGNGVVITYEVMDGTQVRLIAVDNCHVIADFFAPAGSSHAIRLAPDGRLGVVEDITGQAIEFGPGIEEREPSGCP